MALSFHKNVSVDSIFFFAKCYHCLGEAFSVTEGILIYVIENIYLYRQYNILICKQNKENSRRFCLLWREKHVTVRLLRSEC